MWRDCCQIVFQVRLKMRFHLHLLSVRKRSGRLYYHKGELLDLWLEHYFKNTRNLHEVFEDNIGRPTALFDR
jgi:hypothetical protein